MAAPEATPEAVTPDERWAMSFRWPDLCSTRELAILLGCKPADVRALVGEGLPVEPGHRGTLHPTLDSLTWLLSRSSFRDRWR